MIPFAFWYPVSTGYLNWCYQNVISGLLLFIGMNAVQRAGLNAIGALNGSDSIML